MMYAPYVLLVSLFVNSAFAQTTAIINAHIYTMGQLGELASGTVVIRDGRIVGVGGKLNPPAGATIIDAKGRIVTPGLFILGTNLGAIEINAVDSTNDTATKNPRLSAAFDIQYGIDPSSTAISVARAAGVTRALVTPGYLTDEMRDFVFAGQAAVITLGVNMKPVVHAKAAMVLDLGESGAARSGRARGSTIVALKADLDDVRWYARHRDRFDRGLSRKLRLSKADLDSLVPVIERRMPLIVAASRASDILEALRLSKQEGFSMILRGADEGWMVAKEIAKAGVPVMLNPTYNLPASFEKRGATLENAARLNAAGVTIAFDNADGAHRLREVRYNAGNAVAHGLPYEAALAAMTIHPARMFKEDKIVGSLEPGKSADLVIWSGDPLEPLTSADAVYIAGRLQPTSSRSQELSRRYKNLAGPYPPAYSADEKI